MEENVSWCGVTMRSLLLCQIGNEMSAILLTYLSQHWSHFAVFDSEFSTATLKSTAPGINPLQILCLAQNYSMKSTTWNVNDFPTWQRIWFSVGPTSEVNELRISVESLSINECVSGMHQQTYRYLHGHMYPIHRALICSPPPSLSPSDRLENSMASGGAIAPNVKYQDSTHHALHCWVLRSESERAREETWIFGGREGGG